MGPPGRNLTGPRSPRAQRYQRRAVFAIRFRGDQNSGPASHSLIAGYMVMAFTSDIRGQQGQARYSVVNLLLAASKRWARGSSGSAAAAAPWKPSSRR